MQTEYLIVMTMGRASIRFLFCLNDDFEGEATTFNTEPEISTQPKF